MIPTKSSALNGICTRDLVMEILFKTGHITAYWVYIEMFVSEFNIAIIQQTYVISQQLDRKLLQAVFHIEIMLKYNMNNNVYL